MTIETFKKSINAGLPPNIPSPYLLSLWYDGAGDWQRSHDIIQDIEDTTAAWIHAYLHRKEGDIGNADYWYRRAKRSRPQISLEEEWESIVNWLLSANKGTA